MAKIHFTGILPALVTPLDRHGRVRTGTVQALIDAGYRAGATGFYVAGGTGEGVLLSVAQRREMAEAAIAANAGRGKIIIHTGSINGNEVIELTRHAAACGADGVSAVPPSLYFHYTMEETVAFYRRTAEESNGLPLMVYACAQSGCGVEINRMMERLLAVENICGIKDTRGNCFRIWELKQLNGGDINVINGPDEMLLPGLAAGADGGIGSTYSLMPELYVGLHRSFRAGDLARARGFQDRINRVVSVICRWAEGNVIRPVKESLRLSGYDVGAAVYPAQEYSREKLAAFKAEMEAAGYVYPA